MVTLYVAHTGAAVAAVLPHDALASTAVATRWLVRTGAVLAVSLALGVGAILASAVLPGQPSLLIPLLGMGAAIGVSGLIAWLLRHGSTR
jgi:hypothetical protein